jgi:SAM-dependent MidA family methyltransferase
VPAAAELHRVRRSNNATVPLEPGATDITADTNFSAIADPAKRSGASVEIHRQDDFLDGLGLGDHISEFR